MALKTEGIHPADFIATESPGYISRDTVVVTVPASTALSAGFVLAKLAATGRYVPYDNAGSDGSEVAAAILFAGLENSALAPADIKGVVLNFGCEVRKADLVWDSGVNDAGKLAAYADLAVNGVKARD